MGQVLSLLICGTAVSSQYLVQNGVETPMLQSFLSYVLLLLVYTTLLSTQKGRDADGERASKAEMCSCDWGKAKIGCAVLAR